MPKTDVPGGEIVVAQDPQGAVFALFADASTTEPGHRRARRFARAAGPLIPATLRARTDTVAFTFRPARRTTTRRRRVVRLIRRPSLRRAVTW